MLTYWHSSYQQLLTASNNDCCCICYKEKNLLFWLEMQFVCLASNKFPFLIKDIAHQRAQVIKVVVINILLLTFYRLVVNVGLFFFHFLLLYLLVSWRWFSFDWIFWFQGAYILINLFFDFIDNLYNRFRG